MTIFSAPAARVFCLSATGCLLLLSVLLAPGAASARAASFDAPPLEWKLDATGNATIQQILAPPPAAARPEVFFAPYGKADLTIRRAGAAWFRFPLVPAKGKTLFLDLNGALAGHLPDAATVWLVLTENAASRILPLRPVTPGLYRLPQLSTAQIAVYIRTDGLPGPGFAPSLRGEDVLSPLDLDGMFWPAALLCALFLLTLARGLLERREWRLWAALYLGAVCAALAWNLPALRGGLFALRDLPGLLAPGVALLLFPHVGRQLMRTRETAPVLNLLLILAALAGLGAALLPCLPGYAGWARFLPLWPLGLGLCLPLALSALLCRLPGSLRFLTATLLPLSGYVVWLFPSQAATALSLLNLGALEGGLLKLLPALALCLHALFLLLIPTPRHSLAEASRRAAQPDQTDTAPPIPPSVEPAPAAPAVSPETLQLERIRQEVAALSALPLRPELQHWARGATEALRALDTPTAEPDSPAEPDLFSLHQVILAAHNALQDMAEDKNLSLSWYMAPHLAHRYSGNRAALSRVLTALLESAVLATGRGQVQIRAQRLPESNDPGQLLFTISDTGSGTPPVGRNAAALTQAWEMAGRLGGAISMTSGPAGTSVSFTLRLRPAGADTQPVAEADSPMLKATLSGALRVLIVSDVAANRQLLAYYLDELPHELREARGTMEAIALYAQTPGSIVLFDGDLPEADIVHAIARIRAIEGEHDYPLAALLALTNDEAQAERLRRAGCTHTMSKPVSRTRLRHLVLRLAPLPKPRASTPKPARGGAEGKRRQSAVTMTPPAHRDWMLLTTLNEAPADTAPRAPEETPPAVVVEEITPAREETRPAAQSAESPAPEDGKAPLLFLQPPTLRVRSNVGEPMPLQPEAIEAAERARKAVRPRYAPRTAQEAAQPLAETSAQASPAQEMPPSAPAASNLPTAVQTPALAPQPNAAPVSPAHESAPETASAAVERARRAARPVQVIPSTPRYPVTGTDSGEWVGNPAPIPRIGPDTAPRAPKQEELPLKRQEPSAAAGATANAAAKPPRRVSAGSVTDEDVERPRPAPAAHAIPRKKPGFFARLFGRGKPAPDAFELYDAPPGRNAYEWVGEPMPIVKPAPDAGQSPDAAPTATQGTTPPAKPAAEPATEPTVEPATEPTPAAKPPRKADFPAFAALALTAPEQPRPEPSAADSTAEMAEKTAETEAATIAAALRPAPFAAPAAQEAEPAAPSEALAAPAPDSPELSPAPEPAEMSSPAPESIAASDSTPEPAGMLEAAPEQAPDSAGPIPVRNVMEPLSLLPLGKKDQR